jgi:hypothetical protein
MLAWLPSLCSSSSRLVPSTLSSYSDAGYETYHHEPPCGKLGEDCLNRPENEVNLLQTHSHPARTVTPCSSTLGSSNRVYTTTR